MVGKVKFSTVGGKGGAAPHRGSRTESRDMHPNCFPQTGDTGYIQMDTPPKMLITYAQSEHIHPRTGPKLASTHSRTHTHTAIKG